jgi:hypothetical protein
MYMRACLQSCNGPYAIVSRRSATMVIVDMTKSFDIPNKYKAVVYDKPGSISTKVEELNTPEPGSGEVLVRLCVSHFFDPLLPSSIKELSLISGSLFLLNGCY